LSLNPFKIIEQTSFKENLESDPSKMNFGSGGNTTAKAWKDIWGCGQGIGNIDKVLSAS